MATTILTEGIEEYQSNITFGNGIDITGGLQTTGG